MLLRASNLDALSTSTTWLPSPAGSRAARLDAYVFAMITSAPGRMSTFTLGPDGRGRNRIRPPLGSVKLGRQSWSAAIATRTSILVTETLILAQQGRSLIALQVAS